MKYLKILCFLLLLTAIAYLMPRLSVAEPSRECPNSTTHLLELASKLRHLDILEEVPCKLQNIIEVETYLKQQIQKKGLLRQVPYEETVFKMIGIIPEDYNYTQGLINMYTSQLAGYYDKDNKFYAMADWISPGAQIPITVHELTHSLQDQHYDLTRLLDDEPATTDEALARLALVEGDATAVMFDYTNKKSGLPALAEQKSVSSFALSSILSAIISTNSSDTPRSLQSLLIFPYLSGLGFVHAILVQDGYQAVDTMYSNPPKSTREILHPGKYFTRINSDTITEKTDSEISATPRLINSKYNTPSVYTDTLGEFMISSLLNNFVSPIIAGQAAIGWKNDTLSLYQLSENPKKFLLVWDITLETETDAETLFSSLSKAYTERFYQTTKKNNNTLYFRNTVTNTEGYLSKDTSLTIKLEIIN